MEKNEWIPDGFQVVELLEEHRDNQRQQGILFDDEQTNNEYDDIVAKAERVMLPENVQLITDLFGKVSLVSDITRKPVLMELDITPDGSNEVTENDGRPAWEWSSKLEDRSYWLDANYDNLDEKNKVCVVCFTEFNRAGYCLCH